MGRGWGKGVGREVLLGERVGVEGTKKAKNGQPQMSLIAGEERSAPARVTDFLRAGGLPAVGA